MRRLRHNACTPRTIWLSQSTHSFRVSCSHTCHVFWHFKVDFIPHIISILYADRILPELALVSQTFRCERLMDDNKGKDEVAMLILLCCCCCSFLIRSSEPFNCLDIYRFHFTSMSIYMFLSKFESTTISHMSFEDEHINQFTVFEHRDNIFDEHLHTHKHKYFQRNSLSLVWLAWNLNRII